MTYNMIRKILLRAPPTADERVRVEISSMPLRAAASHAPLPSSAKQVGLPVGHAFVEFEKADGAKSALRYLDGGQIDGNHVALALKAMPKPKAKGETCPPHPPAQEGFFRFVF